MVTVTQAVEPEVILWLPIHHNDALFTTWCRDEDLNSFTTFPAAVNLTFDKLLLVQMVAELTVCVWFTALLLNLLQAIETEEQGRRAGQWNRGEGMKVANLLGEKSLMTASTFEGRAQVIVNNAVMKNGYTAAITCGCQWRHICVVIWFYSIPSNFKRSFVFDPLLCFMVLCMRLSYGVTWSPLWKPKSGSSEAVGRWALVHCDAEVGQRQPHVVWQHAINQPDPRRFSSWENDSNSSIFLNLLIWTKFKWRSLL